MEKYRTTMQKEANEFTRVVDIQLRDEEIIKKVVLEIKAQNYLFICTLGRGSSGHAGLFAKYLMEKYLGLLVSNFSPSSCTQYANKINLQQGLFLSISQSGQSQDLNECLNYAKAQGAVTLSFVNESSSPLAKNSHYLIPMLAGEEKSVAATKSYLASLFRCIQFCAHYSQDEQLLSTLSSVPFHLTKRFNSHVWHQALPTLKKEKHMLTLGRGYGFAIAMEAALKFKETCGIHAEALSGAEILHGPIAMVSPGFCCMVFVQQDETLSSMISVIQNLEKLGACLFLVGCGNVLGKIRHVKATFLPTHISSLHPAIDCLFSMLGFYDFVADLAISRGINPDKPKNLRKVTSTK